jgi:hypothetical protein
MIEDCTKHNYTQEEINELCSYEWVIENEGKEAIKIDKKKVKLNDTQSYEDIYVPLEWCIEKHELDEVWEEINEMHDKYGGVK